MRSVLSCQLELCSSSQAALCALRVIKKVPDLTDHFITKAKNLLADRNHGVLLTAITLVVEMVQADPSCLDEFRNVSPAMPQIMLALKSEYPGCSAPCTASQIASHYGIQPRARCFGHHRSFPSSQNPSPASITGKR